MILADIGTVVNRPSIDIELLDELATQLVEDGHAQPAPDRRSDTCQVIAMFDTGASMIVSLLQTAEIERLLRKTISDQDSAE